MLASDRRIRAFGVHLLCAALLAGCGDEGGPLGAEAVAGEYDLHSVNGVPLPYTLPDPGVPGTWEVRGEALTLKPDESFERVLAMRVTYEDGRTESATGRMRGRYELDGTSVTFRASGPQGEEVFAGRVTGERLSVVLPSTPPTELTYRKR